MDRYVMDRYVMDRYVEDFHRVPNTFSNNYLPLESALCRICGLSRLYKPSHPYPRPLILTAPSPAGRIAALANRPSSSQQPAASTQQPAPSTQHPAASTQHPAPSSQHPAPSTQNPAHNPHCQTPASPRRARTPRPVAASALQWQTNDYGHRHRLRAKRHHPTSRRRRRLRSRGRRAPRQPPPGIQRPKLEPSPSPPGAASEVSTPLGSPGAHNLRRKLLRPVLNPADVALLDSMAGGTAREIAEIAGRELIQAPEGEDEE
ncbi:hypothetical protein GMDG_02099 [Pseudogymnoascus destructans 20631-21]|uniref:Uncharacterized protein n=1 Tax=Pseudogymnoascus destructans (strain ATCC MYA-4855 / 20631-21) TaxID=658429 RepID=L8FZT5_PSED2|nr:hypothetical protein GMDG_02099 [Pseudogymnoascus destructans 20631-21]